MYAWIWRRLPGGWPAKLVASAILVIAVVALLFLVVFPWLGPRLPLDHITVGDRAHPVVVHERSRSAASDGSLRGTLPWGVVRETAAGNG
jgi:hypothetical protein